MKGLSNGKIVSGNKVINNGYIVFNNKIIDIGEGQLPANSYSEIVNANGNYIIPGMIDIHTHGNSGFDVMDASEHSLKSIAQFLAEHGVTSFLPTTMTSPWQEIQKALENIRNLSKQDLHCRVLGAHLEGPFLNKEKKGAQSPDNIISPDLSLLEEYLDTIKIITYAPECDTKLSFTREIIEKYPQVVLSAGHTNANYELAYDAIEMGVKSATHMFNAMTLMHHREPGIAVAVFETDTYCELIADNTHVHPAWYNILYQLKGPERLILISDAMKATGLDDGSYIFGGQGVEVKNSIAHLKHNGALAGSTLTINNAAKNFIKATDCSILDIVKMVSSNPAKLLSMEDKIGSLSVGKYADIVICNNDFKIIKTYLNGAQVYKNNKK